jgi:hypothetical protein
MIPDSFVDADDIVANTMGDRILRISRLFLDEEGKEGLGLRKSSSHADPAQVTWRGLATPLHHGHWRDCLPATILDVILLE